MGEGQSSVTDQPPEQPNHQSKTEPKLKTDKTSRRKKSEDGQQGSAELPQTKPISALGACIHHRRHEQGDQDEESDLEQRPAASEEYQSKAEVAQNAKAGGYAEDFENVRCCEHTAGGPSVTQEGADCGHFLCQRVGGVCLQGGGEQQQGGGNLRPGYQATSTGYQATSTGHQATPGYQNLPCSPQMQTVVWRSIPISRTSNNNNNNNKRAGLTLDLGNAFLQGEALV